MKNCYLSTKVEQAKTTYCLLGKALERQKRFEDQGISKLKL